MLNFFNIFSRILSYFQYLIILADMQISGYVSSVGQGTEANKKNDQNVTVKHYDLYLHTKENVRRGYVLASRRGKF